MRDIVFRGKPKNEAEYETLRELSEDDCENGFVYGSLVVSHNKYYICTMALQIRGGISDYITTMIDVLPETIGQYTGLADKNGTKIFEGDIVKRFLLGKMYIFQIGYDNGLTSFIGQAGIKFTTFDYDPAEFDSAGFEVVGNIYDNPELLGGNG